MSENPKLFISYSWSNYEHQQWVIDLATQLRELGVETILDVWDLKEGQDTIKFMEKMVNDKDIKKVIMICDRKYVEKTNNGERGVGTEAQIISPEIYASHNQEKFVAVIREKDERGNPHLPHYYKSRIYIDLSEDDSQEFEKLLRWIYDKPLYDKPSLGKKPSFLEDEHNTGISLRTSSLARLCADAIRSNKKNAQRLLDDYFTLFAKNLEFFRLKDMETEEGFLKNIEDFLPFRNEVLSIISTMIQHSDFQEQSIERIHLFIEDIIVYTSVLDHISRYIDTDFDNYKFIIHELFLYILVILFKFKRIDEMNYLLDKPYYFKNKYSKTNVDFTSINTHIRSIYRLREKNKSISFQGHLLKERCKNYTIDFEYIMQMDFMLFIRSYGDTSSYVRWFPHTLIYHNEVGSSFEIFIRSESKSYFNKIKSLFCLKNKDELNNILIFYEENTQKVPYYNNSFISLRALVNYDKLETLP